MNRDGVELWDAGGSESYLYTEVWLITKELRQEFPTYTIYLRSGWPIGWQFRIPKRLVRHLQGRFAKFGKSEEEIAGKPAVKNQPLTGTIQSEFTSG